MLAAGLLMILIELPAACQERLAGSRALLLAAAACGKFNGAKQCIKVWRAKR